MIVVLLIVCLKEALRYVIRSILRTIILLHSRILRIANGNATRMVRMIFRVMKLKLVMEAVLLEIVEKSTVY